MKPKIEFDKNMDSDDIACMEKAMVFEEGISEKECMMNFEVH